ncbi:hypothetical protein [Vibrio caribbeanicus]|uniref:hypothetical protein n=1 Tax=Vibrio caribbeanicus TaxID=701175 RepID=UPI00228380D3|nr:hypothetical protein [Vibrio caribbeanicus]MCY9844861.1 hypothetical protein [Vibrio caribbeanicus]
MKIGNDACKARQLALWERATAPISSSNNLVRVDYYAALFSLNSTRWHRSESCILKSLGYNDWWIKEVRPRVFSLIDEDSVSVKLIQPLDLF